MSEYVSKKALLEHIRREIGITERQRDAVMTRHMKEFHGGAIRALQNFEHAVQSSAFDADDSEVQRLRSLLERLDSYIDFSEHLSPGDWGIEDVTGINSLFDEVREALDGHDWAYVGKNPVQICRRCRKLWWQAEKICPGTKAPEGDGNDA